MKKFKPAFWDHKEIAGSDSYISLSFARKWRLIVLFTSFMALLPLFVMTIIEFGLTHRLIENEIKNDMSKMLSYACASISFSKDYKKSALNYIDRLDPGKDDDFFLVNKDGMLLTPSYYYGSPGTADIFDKTLLTGSKEIQTKMAPNNQKVMIGYSKIQGSSLFFVLVKSDQWLIDLWLKPRLKLVGYLIISIVLIVLSIMGMATYLVGRIHIADRKRSEAVHSAEYANKLASIGRLASGVAHEINNPLAIINQKTGLILDLFTMREDLSSDERLIPLTNDVLYAVNRCSAVTRRLLDFARHMEPSIEIVDIGEVIGQVLAFLRKEATVRHIVIAVDDMTPIPKFECDKGSLQQIFLNLIENAFFAMEDGGKLDITFKLNTNETVVINVSDNGIGISDEDINKIFEPFYSSRSDQGHTGMGLSIIYGLVKEIHGDIEVKSVVGKGSTFILTLPLKIESKLKKNDISTDISPDIGPDILAGQSSDLDQDLPDKINDTCGVNNGRR